MFPKLSEYKERKLSGPLKLQGLLQMVGGEDNLNELKMEIKIHLVHAKLLDTHMSTLETLNIVNYIMLARPKHYDMFIEILEIIIDIIKKTTCCNESNSNENSSFGLTSEKLFSIFGLNKPVLVYMFQNNYITYSTICKNCSFEDNRYKLLFPEIKEKNAAGYKLLQEYRWFTSFVNEQMKLGKNVRNKIENESETDEKILIERYKKRRSRFHNDEKIARIIRKDQIDKFQLFISQSNFDINFYISRSVFESDGYLQQGNISLIEYSAYFGSLNIFKYLFLQPEIKLTQSIPVMAYIGGCYEIIHLVESKYSVIFSNDQQNKLENSLEKCLSYSVSGFTIELIQYLFENINTKNLINVIFSCLSKYNYEAFFYFLEKAPDVILCQINCLNMINLMILHRNLNMIKFLMKAEVVDINQKLCFILNFEN